MDYQRINATTERWRDAQGTFTFSVPYPGIVRQTIEGRASIALGQKIIEKLEEALARHGKLRVFDDWEHATGYESEVRIRLTEWTRFHQDSIPETHILVGSKIVSMGLAVAAMVLKQPLEVYSNRARFERAYATTAAAAREQRASRDG
jgi:hypothetical protein